MAPPDNDGHLEETFQETTSLRDEDREVRNEPEVDPQQENKDIIRCVCLILIKECIERGSTEIELEMH